MKKILVLAGALALAACALAQDNNRPRTIVFTAFDFQEATGAGTDVSTSPGAPLSLTAVTTVNVYSYLYVYGYGFGSTSNVYGWGGAIGDSGVTDLDIYHNEVLGLTASNFADPTIQGPVTFGQNPKIDLVFDYSLIGAGGVPLGSAFGVNSYLLNNMNRTVFPASSGGHVTLKINRHLLVTANNGPGVYKNTGTFTISRS